MRVRIPTPLRSYTGSQSVVEAEGTTIAEVLDDLDRRYPGIKFRMVDEQGRLRSHMSVFIRAERERDLDTRVDDVDALYAQAVGAGCTVLFPLTDAFWGDRYAQVRDPFGHRWGLGTHVKDLTPEECMAAMEQSFGEG